MSTEEQGRNPAYDGPMGIFEGYDEEELEIMPDVDCMRFPVNRIRARGERVYVLVGQKDSSSHFHLDKDGNPYGCSAMTTFDVMGHPGGHHAL